MLNSSVIICDSEKKNENSVDTCNKCLELAAELVKKNDVYIELSKRVAKLLFENEKLHKEKQHLKKTYKELYDSIKPSRVHAKEQCDSLITNLKSMENANLKTQIQEKVFASAALKNELRKLKRKNVIDTAVTKPYATTIAP
ncbi:hypothetical protein Tco_0490890 [Tanacetum coccineum]